MGFYDEIIWEREIPDGRVPPGTVFQTKSLGCGLDRFTLNADGRLILHKAQYKPIEPDPVEAQDKFLPIFESVPVGDVDRNFHGDISLIGPDSRKEWVEYAARFTYGTLEWIKPLESLTEQEQLWLSAAV